MHMTPIDIFGYVLAFSFVGYLLYHLYLTTILKRKILPGLPDMIYMDVLFILAFIYVTLKKDYALMILLGAFVIWNLLGKIDMLKKKH
jgi:hypothetical protein